MVKTRLEIISRVNDGVYAEFWTPQWILELAYRVLGKVNLDPASNNEPYQVQADVHYTAKTNGLLLPWRGKVWLNPPYGKHIGKWTAKLVADYEAGRVSEALLLVPGKIETGWYQPLTDYPICQLKGRVKFETPFRINSATGKAQLTTQQLFGSVLVYFGANVDFFAEVFGRHGPIMVPYVK